MIALRSVGLSVCYLVSSMKDEEKMVVCHNLSTPNQSYKFLFTTPRPEIITTPNVKHLVQTTSANNTLAQFVIDEAHCIDCWGFNFHPSYSSLGSLKDYYSKSKSVNKKIVPKWVDHVFISWNYNLKVLPFVTKHGSSIITVPFDVASWNSL